MRCHCYGPSRGMCCAWVGRFALSSKPRSREGRLVVWLMDPCFCIKFCWNLWLSCLGVEYLTTPISSPVARLHFAISLLFCLVGQSTSMVHRKYWTSLQSSSVCVGSTGKAIKTDCKQGTELWWWVWLCVAHQWGAWLPQCAVWLPLIQHVPL